MKNYYVTRVDGNFRFYITPRSKQEKVKKGKKQYQEVALELLLERSKRK
jgi:topoisomerase IA-like protein